MPLEALTMIALAACAPAQALDVPVGGNGVPPLVEGPVMTNAGSVVVGLGSSRPRFDVLAFSPTLSGSRTLLSFGRQPKGYGLDVTLEPAGDGVLVATANVSPAFHCCSRTYLRAALTWYPELGRPGQVIKECPEPCGAYPWTPPLYYTASDGKRAVIVDAGRVTVRDLASGAETPVQFDDASNQPGDAEEPQIAGSYLVYPSAHDVVNWQTGEVVHRVPSIAKFGLLTDGTIIYADHEGKAWKPKDHFLRWAPGEAEPTPYPRPGRLLAVAGGRILVSTTSGLQIWNPDGSVAEKFGPNPSADYFARPYLEHYAFNGTRLATVQASCLIARIEIREPGQAARKPIPKFCAVPRVASGTLSNHTATVRVRCPKQYAQGCVGKIALINPHIPGSKPRTVAMDRGHAMTVHLAHWKSSQVCTGIRHARHWRLAITTPREEPLTTPREESDAVTIRVRVGRRDRCRRAS